MKRQSIVWGLVVMFALVLAVQADAQTPAPPPTAKTDAAKGEAAVPTLSEVDALKLDKMLLRQQNLSLQIQSLQQALQQANDEAPKLKAEAEQFIAGLQRSGYDLKSDGKGGYVYAPKPPETSEPEKPAAAAAKPAPKK